MIQCDEHDRDVRHDAVEVAALIEVEWEEMVSNGGEKDSTGGKTMEASGCELDGCIPEKGFFDCGEAWSGPVDEEGLGQKEEEREDGKVMAEGEKGCAERESEGRHHWCWLSARDDAMRC